MKRRLPLLMLIHQRKWKNLPPTYPLSNTESFCSSQPNSSSSSNRESDVSLRLLGDTNWLERAAFENPALWLRRRHNPATTFLKYLCIIHISWSYFFPHFGHHNIAFKSALRVSAWFGHTMSRHTWRICVTFRAVLNSRHFPSLLNLFGYPVWREEEPGAAFKQPCLTCLPLPEWRMSSWDQLMPRSSKGWLPLCSPHLCISLSDQP